MIEYFDRRTDAGYVGGIGIPFSQARVSSLYALSFFRLTQWRQFIPSRISQFLTKD